MYSIGKGKLILDEFFVEPYLKCHKKINFLGFQIKQRMKCKWKCTSCQSILCYNSYSLLLSQIFWDQQFESSYVWLHLLCSNVQQILIHIFCFRSVWAVPLLAASPLVFSVNSSSLPATKVSLKPFPESTLKFFAWTNIPWTLKRIPSSVVNSKL